MRFGGLVQVSTTPRLRLGRAVQVSAAVALCVLATAGVACKGSAAAGPDAGDLRDGGKGLLDAGDARAPSSTSLAYDSGIADEQIPATSSEELTARAKHLLEAIAHDNSDLGADMLFPRDAYLAARDVADPGKVWEKQVSSLFKRQVHRLSRKKGTDHAQFVSIELGHSVVQAVPHKRDWKKPLWRVKHSKITFSIEGKMHRLDVAEMTAWRGAWYVTRLE